MKKIIAFSLFIAFFAITNSQSQETIQQNKPDYWGTFCLKTLTVGDTNFFKVDLTQLTSEFEKIYFKYYYLEQDVFHSHINIYNIESGEAIIAVPKKYTIEDYRHFMANMKKMTFTANYNFTIEQKENYIINHKGEIK
ncbi:MAG: hypothetical protein ACOYLE_04655 [Bacteroidales bacterium]